MYTFVTHKIFYRYNSQIQCIFSEGIYRGYYTQARNATIQKMLRMVGFGDNIGSGFQKIMKAWHSLGYGNPEIHEEDEVHEVWLILPLTLLKNVTDKTGNVTDKTGNVTDKTGNVTDKTGNITDKTGNVTDKTGNVTDKTEFVPKAILRRESLLEILKSNASVTTEELALLLNVSKRTIIRDIEILTKSGIISREGSAFGGRWIIGNAVVN